MDEQIHDNMDIETTTELPQPQGDAFNAWDIPEPPESRPMNNMAIAGFACAFMTPIPGLILSFMAHRQCQERNEDGQGLATAGIVVAVLNLMLRLLLIVLAIALFAWGAAQYNAALDMLMPPPDMFGGLPPGMFW